MLEMLAAQRFPAGTPGFLQQRSAATRAGRRRLALVLQAGNAAALLARGSSGSGDPPSGPSGNGEEPRPRTPTPAVGSQPSTAALIAAGILPPSAVGGAAPDLAMIDEEEVVAWPAPPEPREGPQPLGVSPWFGAARTQGLRSVGPRPPRPRDTSAPLPGGRGRGDWRPRLRHVLRPAVSPVAGASAAVMEECVPVGLELRSGPVRFVEEAASHAPSAGRPH